MSQETPIDVVNNNQYLSNNVGLLGTTAAVATGAGLAARILQSMLATTAPRKKQLPPNAIMVPGLAKAATGQPGLNSVGDWFGLYRDPATPDVGRSFWKGHMASGSSPTHAPWFLPALATAALVPAFGGYQLANLILNKRHQMSIKDDLNESKQNFEQALLEAQMGHKSAGLQKQSALDRLAEKLAALLDPAEAAPPSPPAGIVESKPGPEVFRPGARGVADVVDGVKYMDRFSEDKPPYFVPPGEVQPVLGKSYVRESILGSTNSTRLQGTRPDGFMLPRSGPPSTLNSLTGGRFGTPGWTMAGGATTNSNAKLSHPVATETPMVPSFTDRILFGKDAKPPAAPSGVGGKPGPSPGSPPMGVNKSGVAVKAAVGEETVRDWGGMGTGLGASLLLASLLSGGVLGYGAARKYDPYKLESERARRRLAERWATAPPQVYVTSNPEIAQPLTAA